MSSSDTDFQKQMEFIFEVVLLTIIGILGIIGNAIAMFIFSSHPHQLKFHRLMLMLIIYDTVYILLSMVLFSVPEWNSSYKENGLHYYILPKALPVAQIALTGSIYSTLAITIERWLIVCYPFYTISHKWPAKYYIIPIVTFSLLYNVPKFFELTTAIDLIDPLTGNITATWTNDFTNASDIQEEFLTRFRVEPTALRVNEYYIRIYCIWMNFAFMGLGPFVVLIALNASTLHHLVRQQEQQSFERQPSLTSAFISANDYSHKNDIVLAKVSLMIVFVFILCHSVKWIPNLYELARLARTDKRSWPPWVESITHVAHFLMTFNSSVNFYIYFVKHHQDIINLIQRRRTSHPNARALDLPQLSFRLHSSPEVNGVTSINTNLGNQNHHLKTGNNRLSID